MLESFDTASQFGKAYKALKEVIREKIWKITELGEKRFKPCIIQVLSGFLYRSLRYLYFVQEASSVMYVVRDILIVS